MSANLISDRPASISLLRILVMLLIGYVVMGNVVAMLVIGFLYDGNLIEAIANPQDHPEIRNILLFAQGLAGLVGLVLTPWYYMRSIERRSPAVLFGKIPSAIWVGILAVVVIAFGVSISPVSQWNAEAHFPSWTGAIGDYLTSMEKQAEVLVRLFTANLTPATFSLILVVVSILPGIGEEFVFRGMIQTELQRAVGNPHVGIWIAAAFFSAFHLQFFGFFPRMLIGALLGYLYFWSGNLWVPIIAHMLNNGLQLLGIYLYQLNVHSFDPMSTESAPLAAVVSSLIVTLSLLYYCKKNLPPQSHTNSDRTS